jgi:hypothetical protein
MFMAINLSKKKKQTEVKSTRKYIDINTLNFDELTLSDTEKLNRCIISFFKMCKKNNWKINIEAVEKPGSLFEQRKKFKPYAEVREVKEA